MQIVLRGFGVRGDAAADSGKRAEYADEHVNADGDDNEHPQRGDDQQKPNPLGRNDAGCARFGQNGDSLEAVFGQGMPHQRVIADILDGCVARQLLLRKAERAEGTRRVAQQQTAIRENADHLLQ